MDGPMLVCWSSFSASCSLKGPGLLVPSRSLPGPQFPLCRSGSMSGPPLEHAKSALQFGLEHLGPQEEFGLIVFDHEQVSFAETLRAGTAANREVRRVPARDVV